MKDFPEWWKAVYWGANGFALGFLACGWMYFLLG